MSGKKIVHLKLDAEKQGPGPVTPMAEQLARSLKTKAPKAIAGASEKERPYALVGIREETKKETEKDIGADDEVLHNARALMHLTLYFVLPDKDKAGSGGSSAKNKKGRKKKASPLATQSPSAKDASSGDKTVTSLAKASTDEKPALQELRELLEKGVDENTFAAFDGYGTLAAVLETEFLEIPSLDAYQEKLLIEIQELEAPMEQVGWIYLVHHLNPANEAFIKHADAVLQKLLDNPGLADIERDVVAAGITLLHDTEFAPVFTAPNALPALVQAPVVSGLNPHWNMPPVQSINPLAVTTPFSVVQGIAPLPALTPFSPLAASLPTTIPLSNALVNPLWGVPEKASEATHSTTPHHTDTPALDVSHPVAETSLDNTGLSDHVDARAELISSYLINQSLMDRLDVPEMPIPNVPEPDTATVSPLYIKTAPVPAPKPNFSDPVFSGALATSEN